MYHAPDETTIKLHTADDGTVWYAVGIHPPKASEQPVEEFMRSQVISRMGTTVRLLGTAQNAELISSLHLRRFKGEIRSVEVAGPQSFTTAELAEPKLVLMKMRGLAVASAAGGWHEVSQHDHAIYAMAARMRRSGFEFDDTVSTYVQRHPAYRALSFIPTVSLEEVAKLLITIIDPRWFVDLRLPERTSKLELFLGLTPKTQASVSALNVLLKRPRELRCANVLACWKTELPSQVDISLPANFLYRIHAAAGAGTRGDLRASQSFVRYLRHNWLAGLEHRSGVKDGLFAPDLFFKSPVEIAAYADHMRAARSN
jgi:hypothetical protein